MAETETPCLLTSLDDGILRLTMNRPRARNALSMEMLGALQAALNDAAEDGQVRAIIIAADAIWRLGA